MSFKTIFIIIFFLTKSTNYTKGKGNFTKNGLNLDVMIKSATLSHSGRCQASELLNTRNSLRVCSLCIIFIPAGTGNVYHTSNIEWMLVIWNEGNSHWHHTKNPTKAVRLNCRANPSTHETTGWEISNVGFWLNILSILA